MGKRKYRSDALRSVHVTVKGLYDIGLVDRRPCAGSMHPA